MTTLFRDMHLKRESYVLHGLALIGVRAVLGVESERGSPFNIQRSLHVPNFTREEVEDLFFQYRSESGQEVAQEVVRSVYDVTRGQPGLVGWFDELLTETHNPGADQPIGMEVWSDAYRLAGVKHWNNNILNLVRKAESINPWKDQPRRDDMHFMETAGHFHLYAWTKEAVGDMCEFSSGFHHLIKQFPWQNQRHRMSG